MPGFSLAPVRSTEAPALSSASVRASGVAAVRLVLGVAFIAGSTVRGLHGGPAVLAAAGGALVLVVIALGQRSRPGATPLGEAVPVPSGARFDPGWLGVLLACIPSTIGVSAMAVLALVFSPALAAVLGGVLIALGVLAAAAWIQLASRERRENVSYWIARGPRPRVFTSGREAFTAAGAGRRAQATEPERTD